VGLARGRISASGGALRETARFEFPASLKLRRRAGGLFLNGMSRSFETVIHLAMFTLAIAVIVAVMAG